MVFFDNGAFEVTERSLPVDEVIPVKLALKAKLNSHGGLDKLKARILDKEYEQFCPCRGSSSDTTANKINPYYLIG